MTDSKKPRKPRSRFPGIRCRFTGGAWKWRAVATVNGQRKTGAYKLREEDAHADYLALTLHRDEKPSQVPTLKQALDAVVALRVETSSRPKLAGITLGSNVRYILSYFDGAAPLDKLTVADLEWYVKATQTETLTRTGKVKKPRSINTIVQKDFWLIRRAFNMANLPNPVDGLKRSGRFPKKVKPLASYLTAREVTALIARIRSDEFGGCHERFAHADIIQLIAYTAVRPGELCRVKVTDVSLTERKILVREAKVRTEPRALDIPDALLPAVERLLERAKEANAMFLLWRGEHYVANRVMQLWKKRLNEPRLHSRGLRHSAITAYCEATGDVLSSSAFAGHTNVSTTNRYLHATRRKGGAEALAAMYEPGAEAPTFTTRRGDRDAG